jgi:IclR family transcriptional regulator, acetate operon repressor
VTTGDDTTRPQYPIGSVDNALRILLLLGERRSIRLTDVSEYLGVATSTAHRLMAMLLYRGFVRQREGSRAYEPGPALTTIAFAVLRQVDLRARLHPYLERLSSGLGETVHLTRLDGSTVSFVDTVESPRAVRVGSRLGTTLPAHSTSSGKTLLTMLDDDAIRALYPDERLPRVSARTGTKRSDLLKQVAEARKLGYATSEEESEDGVASVCVPLGGYGGARYALEVASPQGRMTDEARAEIVAELLDVATEVRSYFP